MLCKSFLARVFMGGRNTNPLNPIEPTATEEQEFSVPRPLRAFDWEVVAPYDSEALVAFMKADKLSDLTKDEIRHHLLLVDTPLGVPRTVEWIAEYLPMTPRRVREALNGLKRKGYALSGTPQRASGDRKAAETWFCDRHHYWADPEMLYWEFAPL